MSDLEFTGERFIPGTRGEIWIEHWHRYHFASAFVAGKRVLDIACGEGYGSALLARTAGSVVGVDVSPAAVAHASKAYADRTNLRYVEGSCTAIPLPDASVDVAVTFETLEHIEGQEAFMAELARVLTPEGLLLLSCPNKLEYSDLRGYSNEYHVKELYREELQALVAAKFPSLAWFRQKPTFYSLIVPEAPASAARLVEVEEADPAAAGPELSGALYFLVAASREPRTVAALEAPLHVLADRGDWVHKDYEKVFRMMEFAAGEREAAQAEVKRLQGELAQRDARLASLPPPAPALSGWRAWLARALGLVR